MKKFLPYAFHNGEWKRFEDANMSIATHALHYGIGAFGGLRVVVNSKNSNEMVLFRLDRHCKRLSLSAKYLGADYSKEFIEEKIIEFLQRNKPNTSIYLRPLVYTSDLDISPRLHNVSKDFLLYGLELGDYLSPDGITCCISSYVRQADVSFPLRGKISGAYITSALAKTEAYERGYDESILMNHAGKVSEGSAMNIFMVRDGVIYTPGVTEDILEGITRDSVIKIAKYLGYEVVERPIDKTELFIADEVFMSGTAAKITPVKKIEQYSLPSSRPIFDDLKKTFDEVIAGNIDEFSDWLTYVNV